MSTKVLANTKLPSDHFRSGYLIFLDNPVPTESLLLRTKYKLGHVLLRNGNGEEGTKLIEEAQRGRQELNGTAPKLTIV